ncbi:MAG: hypothetical protein D6778_06490 [Nitrospirae bacterium]|nr:MAG: hypothetical protein D6778_06490 [Nitrospirota bacterium]
MEKVLRLLVVFGIIGLVFVSIQVRTRCIELEASIGKARIQKKALLNKQRLLMAEREKLLSLQRVRYVATERFGLQEPDRKKVVFIVEDGLQNGPVNVTSYETPVGGKD